MHPLNSHFHFFPNIPSLNLASPIRVSVTGAKQSPHLKILFVVISSLYFIAKFIRYFNMNGSCVIVGMDAISNSLSIASIGSLGCLEMQTFSWLEMIVS